MPSTMSYITGNKKTASATVEYNTENEPATVDDVETTQGKQAIKYQKLFKFSYQLSDYSAPSISSSSVSSNPSTPQSMSQDLPSQATS